ncbi:MurR/RpiR family transcriptional regulator [Bradyrhizobium sp. DASA03007]|uniref:MurR/RpiR family transcriptional regulator n=1 Tax=unclassified Bradyrhizobium TaxID=2631580 RepID=UPI003F6F0EE1
MALQKVRELVEKHFDSIPPQLQRAAKYIISAPAEVAMYSMREIADNAAVSPGALTRLALQLGFSGFNELREEFREDITSGNGPQRYARNAKSLTISSKVQERNDQIRSLVRGVLNGAESLFSDEFLDSLGRVADVLEGAKKIYVIGQRNNHAVGYFFFYVTSLLRPNVILVEGRYGMFVDEISEIRAGDAALVISFEPYVRDAVRCTEIAASRGAAVIAITDSTVAPVARQARETIVAPNIGVGFYQSSIPALAIAEVIAALIAKRRGAEGVKRVSAQFEQLAKEGVYWSAPARKRKG